MAQGRGEAFDYLLGERTSASAALAERMAAARLLRARRPVLSVNGNVAALAAREVATLARAIPGLRVEVNLFHRSPSRARLVAETLRKAGVAGVLGEAPTARLRGLASNRAWVDARGILRADVVLVPLEDGDRAEALVRAGKFVISIDLNPLSRTSRSAQLPIIDGLTRALRGIRRAALRLRAGPPGAYPPLQNTEGGASFRMAALDRIREGLDRWAAREDGPGSAGSSPRDARPPTSGNARPSRRTPPLRSRRHRSPRSPLPR